MSLSIGIVWVTLCFAYAGFEAFAFAAATNARLDYFPVKK
jgi:hypothetical protein